MGLLDLPAELLVTIVELTRPSDVENLGLSCTTMAKVGKDILQRHRIYKRQWQKVNLKSKRQEGGEPQTSLALMLAILKDWRIAEYIESLDLRYYSPEVGVESRIESTLADEHNAAVLERLVADSPYRLSELWSREGWEDDRHHHWRFDPWIYEELTTGVLLSLLPNVRTLRLPDQWHETQYTSHEGGKPTALRQLLDRIIAKANAAESGEAPLSSLETILPYSEAKYDPRNGLCEVLPFMALKSLRSLHVCNMVGVDDGYSGIPFVWCHGEIASSLRTVQLAGGCMDADGIAELVRHTPQLTSFAYSHYTKWHGCLHDWDAGSFVEAIGEHRGDTITNLAVTVDTLFGTVENGVTSLKGFTQLQTLELDVRVFAGPSVASGNRQGDAGEFTGWSPADATSLAEMLPPSVREIRLFVECEAESRQGAILLSKLLSEPGEKEHRPLDLVVRSNRKDDELQEIKELFSNLGLTKYPRWDAHFEHKEKPMWQEDFIERCGEIFE